MIKLFFICLVSSLILFSCNETISPIEEQIDSLFSEFNANTPGAAVGVVQNGELVFKKGYGSANLDYTIPITSTSVFDIASVSKQFGAMAIALLVDKGKIALDDSIQMYLPELGNFGHTITIRNLVHHTSGIRDWPATLALGGWRFDDIISFDQIKRFASFQKELNFEPGSEYTYSNTGYNLLAEIVSRVTGMSFAEWTEENIFFPLQMNNTHFHDDHSSIVKDRVSGYSENEGVYKMQANGLTALGSSSLFTTVEDLVKWVNNFETGQVGGQAVLEMVHQRGILTDGDTIAYAFGQSVSSYKGRKQVTHGGSWAGFRTALVRFPEEQLSIIILSNLGNYNPSAKAYQIAEIFLDFEETEEEQYRGQDRENVEPYAPTPEELKPYTGLYYSSELKTFYELKLKNDSLVAVHFRHGEISIRPKNSEILLADQWFFSPIDIERNADGDVSALLIGRGRMRNVRFEKVDFDSY